MNEYLTNKGYRALINAALLNGIGNSLFNIVFVIYASTTPFKTLAVSLASMALLVPSLLNILTGYFADRTKQKTGWMILSRIAQFVLFAGLTLLIRLPATFPLFLVLLMINIISDCLGAYGGGLQLPLLRRLLPEEALDEAMGFQMAAQTLVQIIFQGLGAWAIVLLNYDFSLFGLINAITLLLAGLSIVQHRTILRNAEPDTNQKTTETKPTKGFRSSLKTTIGLLYSNRFLKTIMIFALAVNTLAACIDGLMNISLLEMTQLLLQNYGNTLAIISITISFGTILGSLITGDFFKHIGTLRIVAYTMLSLALLALNFLWIKNVWLMLGCLFFIGYTSGKINPRMSAYMMREVDEERLAVTSGIFTTIVLLGGPIGQVFFLGIANALTIAISWQIYLLTAAIIGGAAFALSRRLSEPNVGTAESISETTE
ncbi:MFS transporter [Enterococcus sp. BWR-S5]|uniref:MFS transporter n=1 Tax=Enterococcus sp. BWR-S5 TaxID=2787714 RepID=UPI0019238478|nr:MFS transporter [Enterococcus sp. BWR-S5]MBL1224428.1 MFS transporter [Enterococcus sp. BWR-S5]